ncbi:MAG: hypothetical protein ACLTMP_11180 [Eggerthella lenta]
MILPECCYLEALSRCRMQQVTIVSSAVWKIRGFRGVVKVVEPKTGAFQLAAVRRMASRAGKNAEFIATLNGMFRVKDSIRYLIRSST